MWMRVVTYSTSHYDDRSWAFVNTLYKMKLPKTMSQTNDYHLHESKICADRTLQRAIWNPDDFLMTQLEICTECEKSDLPIILKLLGIHFVRLLQYLQCVNLGEHWNYLPIHNLVDGYRNVHFTTVVDIKALLRHDV